MKDPRPSGIQESTASPSTDDLDSARCREAIRLLDGYILALTSFHDLDDDGLKAEAFAALAEARAQYWRHSEIHGCRKHISAA
jgi:hypothetical protein